jgi:hypothetical protein
MTEPTLPASLSAASSLRERVQQVRGLREQYHAATEALNASLTSLHVSTSYTVSMTEEQYALQRTQHGLESRLDRAASPELVLDLAAALTAEQEHARMLQHDNEGHAEYLVALHQQLLTELPDSKTTAALGRLLTAWRRTPNEPQYVPAAALAAAQEREDALREALGTIGAGVEIARQQGNGNAHMDTIYRIACEAMEVQS